MKMKKKQVLLIIGCIFACLIVLREIGVLNVNLYKSKMFTSQSTTKSQTHPGKEKNFSYHMLIKYKSKTLASLTHMHNNLPPIEIVATLEAPAYSGNYALPFFKNFKMKYQCKFTTTKSSSKCNVKGKIKGEVIAKIYGICSRIKAKELAFGEAKKQIQAYFQTQLKLQ